MTPYVRTTIENQSIMHELADLYYKQRATGDNPPTEYIEQLAECLTWSHKAESAGLSRT
jgi:hypothetical protein